MPPSVSRSQDGGQEGRRDFSGQGWQSGHPWFSTPESRYSGGSRHFNASRNGVNFVSIARIASCSFRYGLSLYVCTMSDRPRL
jgi:hypothetical protein